MRSSLTPQIAALVVLCTAASVDARADVLDPCSLLTKDEFAQGQQTYFDPEPYDGFVCSYEGGVVYHFSGTDAQARWDSVLKRLHLEDVEREMIDGIGDNAYAFYTPAEEHLGAHAIVVFSLGEHTVAVGVEAEEGQPGRSVHDKAVSLARIAAARLK